MSRLLRWISQSDTGFSSTWRFFVNVSSNLGLMVLNSGITIWFTPYLISHLGVAAYGLIPLATSLTAYINVIGSALNASVSRYLTVDIQKGQPDVANHTFNTAFWGSIFVSLTLIPILLLFVKFVPTVVTIPDMAEHKVKK